MPENIKPNLRLFLVGAVLAVLLLSSLPDSLAFTGLPTQRGDGLDSSLLSANMCGDGSPGETHFTLAATGDTFPHENIQAVGEARGYDYLFDQLRPFLKAADLAYTNFDGAMLEGSPHTGWPAFNYNPRLAFALKNAGIGLVSTANNHIMDRGPQGLDATLEVLKQAGILQHGTVPTSAAGQPRPAYLPVQLTRNGVSVKVAFLSFSWGTNGNPDPYHQVNPLWASNEYGRQGNIRQSVLDDIAKARSESDFVIVAAHWGTEYEYYPSEAQKEGAARMAAAGADLILGAQSHTLQPVDILDNNGRKTLVIYSLANLIAAQASHQSRFADTSAIFYVDIIRRSDGKVTPGGYRYLPTMMTEGDTRPAAVPLTGGYGDLFEHVRLEMRDFKGARQMNPDPSLIKGRFEVCPAYTFPEVRGNSIGGDFAQYFNTLGSGDSPRSLTESIAMVGYPIAPVMQELSGDCERSTAVLYTERQRLELQPGVNWPFRVVGTQLGTEVYQKKYRLKQVERRLDLDGNAIVNDRFKAFYHSYGGLTVFGYPISGELTEIDSGTGQTKTVQYFERARFEFGAGGPENPNPLYRVQLGLLGREYAGIGSQCALKGSSNRKFRSSLL